jgi:hypothetical protein
MKAPTIKIDTPQLDEQAFANGDFRGIPTDSIGSDKDDKNPFCYSYHHWGFYLNLPKKNRKVLMKMMDEMIALKLSQLMEDSDTWKLENNWIGQLKPNYQILVLKNLQKAMHSKTWHRGSDLFMESALEEIVTEHFSCASDLHNDDDEDNPYADDWKNWLAIFKSFEYEEEYLLENGIPYEDFFWDSDWEIFVPNDKAISDYQVFLIEKF